MLSVCSSSCASCRSNVWFRESCTFNLRYVILLHNQYDTHIYMHTFIVSAVYEDLQRYLSLRVSTAEPGLLGTLPAGDPV